MWTYCINSQVCCINTLTLYHVVSNLRIKISNGQTSRLIPSPTRKYVDVRIHSGYMPNMSPLISMYWFNLMSHDLPFSCRYSCGLFMSTFMEYWSGDVLSDDVTQVQLSLIQSYYPNINRLCLIVYYYYIHINNDNIVQVHITNFRPKLAAILLSSKLNRWKGCQ
jgi:hypothetical protein